MRPRTRAALLGAALATVVTTGVAIAHDGANADDGVIDNAKITHNHHAGDHQHGEVEGHLESGHTDNIDLVSTLALKNVEPGKIADVGVHKGFAYLAAWGGETCKYNGVHVVDIRDVAAPKEVAFIQAKEGSAPGEGIQALSINTKFFKGDILVSNNETCNEKTGFGGLNIYNVSNPGRPSMLVEGFGDETVPGQGKKAANEIHSIFAWQAGANAYAVIVDNDEGADIDIVDITNPKKPVVITEIDADETWPQIVQETPENLVQVFHHDVVVKEIAGKQVMLVSYWDGGYLKLDVTDPRAVTLMADSDFPNPDPELAEQSNGTLIEAPEGNAHQSEFTKNSDFILAADEDFSPTGFEATSDDGGTFFAIPGDQTGEVAVGDTLAGPTVYVGRSCIGDPLPAATAADQIAVATRGLCTFTEKIANIEAAGYAAAIVVNREGADGCGPIAMSVQGQIVAVSVDRSIGYDLFDLAGFDEAACLAGAASELPGVALGTSGDAVSLRSFFDGWGYVRLFQNQADANGKLIQLDSYAIPEAMDPDFAEGFGDLSVHEVATSLVDNDLVYISYYAGGLRVIDISTGEIVEVGHYIAEGGNNFWGVQAFIGSDGEEYIAMSDRDMGLFIFQYNP
jgi:hypothetical protein